MRTNQSYLLTLGRYMTERSPLPMVAAEGQTHIVRYANPAFCRLADRTRDELTGRPFAVAVPEGDENGCLPLLDRVYRTGESETLTEQAHTHTAPGLIYWSYTAWAVLDGEERPTGVMIQTIDTTEAALFRRQMTAVNEALLLSDLRQHELTDIAEGLNIRLQRAMQETNHRVKNNLQVVAALADAQIDGDSLTVPVSALHRIISHTCTLALLHDVLTQQSRGLDDYDTLSTEVSFNRLMPFLQASIGSRRVHSDIAVMTIPLNKSASLSLLVNELVSNAVKHGEGDIFVVLRRDGDQARLTVCDEGSGFSPDFDARTSAHIGLELITSLVRHDMRGSVAFDNLPEGGACITVTFPLAIERDIGKELAGAVRSA